MKYKLKIQFERPSTSDFWYDITDGGYLEPAHFTNDKATLKAIEEAIELLKKLQDMCDLY